MALIKCPDCGKEISDSAPQCIHCGSLNTAVSNRSKDAQKFIQKIGFLGGTLGLIFYSILMLLTILIVAIFSWKVALFFAFVLLGIWWFWLTAIRKIRIK